MQAVQKLKAASRTSISRPLEHQYPKIVDSELGSAAAQRKTSTSQVAMVTVLDAVDELIDER